jgi:molecular chaperone GrpE
MTEDRPDIPIRDKRLTRSHEQTPAPAEPKPDVEALQKLADDRLDQLMRMKADFENFRKRELREKTVLIERASLRIVERLLPVIDDLERALEAAKKHESADSADQLRRGVELVQKHLHEVLVDEGLEKLADGGPFDPQRHEAVSSVPGDVAEPTVLEVVRPGYKLKGKTIRPALVHVSVPEGTPQEGGE